MSGYDVGWEQQGGSVRSSDGYSRGRSNPKAPSLSMLMFLVSLNARSDWGMTLTRGLVGCHWEPVTVIDSTEVAADVGTPIEIINTV